MLFFQVNHSFLVSYTFLLIILLSFDLNNLVNRQDLGNGYIGSLRDLKVSLVIWKLVFITIIINIS